MSDQPWTDERLEQLTSFGRALTSDSVTRQAGHDVLALIAYVREVRAAARAVVARRVLLGPEFPACPECYELEDDPHEPDCTLAALAALLSSGATAGEGGS